MGTIPRTTLGPVITERICTPTKIYAQSIAVAGRPRSAGRGTVLRVEKSLPVNIVGTSDAACLGSGAHRWHLLRCHDGEEALWCRLPVHEPNLFFSMPRTPTFVSRYALETTVCFCYGWIWDSACTTSSPRSPQGSAHTGCRATVRPKSNNVPQQLLTSRAHEICDTQFQGLAR